MHITNQYDQFYEYDDEGNSSCHHLIDTQQYLQKVNRRLSIPTISVPSDLFPRDSIKIPHNVKLADLEFYLPHPIDILIGARTILSFLLSSQINVFRGDYDLQKTSLDHWRRKRIAELS